MSRQAHARVDEKHCEIVGLTFSNTVAKSVWIAFIFGKSTERSIYKRSLVITEAVCCGIFESFCNNGKQKSRDELYAN